MNPGLKKNIPIALLVAALSVFHGVLLVVQYIAPDTDWAGVLFVNNYLILAIIVVYIVLRGIAAHFLLLSYYLCFFIFLMGQKLYHWPEYNVFRTFVRCELLPREYVVFSAVLWLGLVTPFFGYFCSKKVRYAREDTAIRSVSCGVERSNILNIVRVGFYATLPFALYMQLKVALVKAAMGSYTAGYLVNVDVPTIVKMLNYLFIAFALLYLAYRPQTLEVYPVLLSLLVIQGGVQMLQGRRALIASTLLFIVWYLFKYYRVKTISPKALLVLGGVGVGAVLLFSVVERLRSGNAADVGGVSTVIRSFLTSTGGSDSVIANTIQRADRFPKPGVVYLFEPIVSSLRDNPIVANLLEVDRGVAQGAAYVAQHDSFSHWISYLTSENLYEQGYGMGSSYLAESYLAFGLTGVGVIGLLLGRFVVWLEDVTLSRNTVFRNALVFFFVQKIFTLPRGGLFSWFTELFYMLLVMAVLLPFYYADQISVGAVTAKRGKVCE